MESINVLLSVILILGSIAFYLDVRRISKGRDRKSLEVRYHQIQPDGRYLIRLSDHSEYLGRESDWIEVRSNRKLCKEYYKTVFLRCYWSLLDGGKAPCRQK